MEMVPDGVEGREVGQAHGSADGCCCTRRTLEASVCQQILLHEKTTSGISQ